MFGGPEGHVQLLGSVMAMRAGRGGSFPPGSFSACVGSMEQGGEVSLVPCVISPVGGGIYTGAGEWTKGRHQLRFDFWLLHSLAV